MTIPAGDQAQFFSFAKTILVISVQHGLRIISDKEMAAKESLGLVSVLGSGLNKTVMLRRYGQAKHQLIKKFFLQSPPFKLKSPKHFFHDAENRWDDW